MSIKRHRWHVGLWGLAIAGLVLTGCASDDAPEPADGDAEEPEDDAEEAEEPEDDAEEPQADVDDVEIAVVLPLTGTNAQSGTLVLRGAELAVQDVNEAGGIQSLGGANVSLRVEDGGESVETAVSAATRALSGDKPAGGIGSWLSSFTLGVTEVAERQQVPWVTLSYADSISERGFEYTYQTSIISGELARSGLNAFLDLAADQDLTIETIALVGDNTAASEFIFAPIRETIAEELGLEIVDDQVWTPPLTDASPISQSLRTSQPDLIVFGATNFNDASLVLESNQQFDVAAPYMAGGSWLVLPDYVDGLGEERIEGLVSFMGHPLPTSTDLRDRFIEFSGEPFMHPDSVAGYYNTMLIVEAIEIAGSADPQDVNAALKEINLTSGPAAENMVPQTVQFDEIGRRIGAEAVIAQWQSGVPEAVFPFEIATADAVPLVR